MAGLPTGTVTFLFTDLEGSTRLWEQHPEAMQVALARHDAILRDAVERAGGHVIKTTGDGVHAVFATAAAGVRAAIAGQRRLLDEPWTDTGPLRVRMGLHTGAAEQREGDYYGTTLNRAARMMAVAHGGQMVLSQATATIVTDELLEELRLDDLGEQRLRDLERPERVFQVTVPGLPAAFPPLRSHETLPSNLPAQLTSFVGRDADTAGIREQLRRQRLVTIVGVGGVGKTRLALEVAGETLADFRDGAWLCELAAAGDPAAMIDTVASALRVVDSPGTSRRDSLVDFLAARQALVVLDNCEHLLDSVATLVADVLARGRSLRILATSREPLGVAGEQVWALRSLSVPSSSDRSTLAGTDAVRLFVERAQASRAAFVLDDGNAGAVAEICRRLDGIPLAIELAAARSPVMHPAEIAEHLDERFRLLSAGRRAAVDRHQTLRATVDWSYSLLTELERTVFARLSVFPSSFDADAAAAVAGGEGLEAWDVLDATTGLVAKSMLTTEDDTGTTTRFGMLETLRQYGRDRLADAGEPEAETRRQRHCAHFTALATELDRRLSGVDDIAARRDVARDVENLRAAMAWALDRPDHEIDAVHITAHLALLVSTYRSLGLGPWFERAVPAARGAAPGMRFTVLGTAAYSAKQRGDNELADRLVDEAFAPGVPDDAPHYSTGYTVRVLATLTSDLERCVAVAREGAELQDRLGHHFGAISLWGQAGVFAALAGDTETGHRETERALQGARTLGNATALAMELYLWAAARWMDEPSRAVEALEESAALTRAGASDVVYADTLELLGRLRTNAGDLRGALRAFQAAHSETIMVGNRLALTSHWWYLAESLGRRGHHADVAAVVYGICDSEQFVTYPPHLGGRERDLHEEAVAATRAKLGDERYEALVARGRAMPYEDALAYVADELERLLATTS